MRATEGKIGSWKRKWRLRTKLTMVLLVPSVTALAFSVLHVRSELVNASSLDRTVRQVDLSGHITEVVHHLQAERAMVAAAVAAGDQEVLNSARAREQFDQTDEAVEMLRHRAHELHPPGMKRHQFYVGAISPLDRLGSLRELAIDASNPYLAVQTYTSRIEPLVHLGREIAAADTNGTSTRLGAVIHDIGMAKEHAAQLDALVLALSGEDNSHRIANLRHQAQAAAGGFESSIQDFLAITTPEEKRVYRLGYSGTDVDRRRVITHIALTSSDPAAPADVDSPALSRASESANGRLRAVEQELTGLLRDQAAAMASQATRAAWLAIGIVIVALAVALMLTLAVARSLVRPLRRLRREALQVANVRLPNTVEAILADEDPVEAAKKAVRPVPVTAADEIGQVARSFDAVHEQAVRLATEQAVLRDNINHMMVNLARRSQTLVERQLFELDRLEKNEQDPDQLSRFFVLDHLAARLRRNSENLLILSGRGLVRRSSRPMPVNELIGASLSEVEQYTRVIVKQAPDLLVQARVVKDLVHLLAELLDNAAKFSPSDTPVTVNSVRTGAGELAIQISDEGLGIPEEELDEVNARLADPPPFDLAVSRRMGLYVVARLAKQNNIRVRLHAHLGGGMSAVVVLPPDLALEPAMADQHPVVPPEEEDSTPLADESPVRTGTLPRKRPGSRWFRRIPVGTYAEDGDTDTASSPPPGSDRARRPAWNSAGDDGWRAVHSRLGDTGTQTTITSSGLPKRMPRARLVPGSAPAPQAQPPSRVPGSSTRQQSASSLRSRLSAFQQGLNRARGNPNSHREER